MAPKKKTKKKTTRGEPKIMARGQKRKHTKMARADLDRIVAARHARKDREQLAAKTDLVRMDHALNHIWNYIVDPVNRISNHDADRILALIKEGLGTRRMGKGW